MKVIHIEVYKEEGRWDHAARLDASKEGADGSTMALGLLALTTDITPKESSLLSLICKCRLVPLKASGSTSLKARAVFPFHHSGQQGRLAQSCATMQKFCKGPQRVAGTRRNY